MENEKLFQMKFAKVYDLLVQKAERKGRTREEVDTIIRWLTGYSDADLEKAGKEEWTYQTFFSQAPKMNPNRAVLHGSVCKVKLDEIQDPLLLEIRRLDKLIDELAQGKAMDKILRKPGWTCPKCGKTFSRKGQDHYCGNPPATIEEYIASQPENARPYLNALNDAIRQAILQAEERISWSMPTYWKGCNLVQFAGFKKHIGYYPGSEAVEAFENRLSDYKHSKGSIQFPYNKPLPIDLIQDIARWCLEQAEASGKK